MISEGQARGMRFEGTLALSQRAKAARFRLRSSSLQSETMPAQPSYDLLHRIPLVVTILYLITKKNMIT